MGHFDETATVIIVFLVLSIGYLEVRITELERRLGIRHSVGNGSADKGKSR